MNSYIRMQIQNMLTMTMVFDQACELAAQKDDGLIDAAELKTLQQLKTASAKFRKELQKHI